MTKARRIVDVRPEDEASGGGRPHLWGYGTGWLAAVAGVGQQRVREAISNSRGRPPEFDPGDPVEAVAWALERRGHHELAKAVRDALCKAS